MLRYDAAIVVRAAALRNGGIGPGTRTLQIA
jgi:hypothetical protein